MTPHDPSSNAHSADSSSAPQDLLSKVSRYEALFELAEKINAASDIESVGKVLAQRLKYITDIYSWRYICFDGDPEEPETKEPTAIVVDGHRGRGDFQWTVPAALSNLELQLWRDRKTLILSGEAMIESLDQLPSSFHKDDLEQISVNTLVEDGRTRALYLFGRRRQPFTDLDVKCLSMVCGFFHRKVHMLWEQQKLRELERTYLEQEVMLRESEKLATLGRLSAGMAHELNNPAAAARQGAEQLATSVARLERARLALGATGLSSAQLDLVAQLEAEVRERAKKPNVLDPITRSDLEQEMEDWLDQTGVEDPWEHASTLVSMGLSVADMQELTKSFDPSFTPILIDSLGSQFAVHALLGEIAQGAGRIADIVKALKGYSYMDQGPVSSVDVRQGLDDTLVMLSSKLRDGIIVDTDYAEDLPAIEGCGSELNQVWTNLLDNAISAMDGEGTLELKAFHEDDWVVVEVADSGSGIPTEDQEKIFDPFFTTKAPGEGTGLGLSISHSIVVEKHKGHISVDSKPGATRFTVKLPVTHSEQSS
jgi:signal transduction histidine kinase